MNNRGSGLYRGSEDARAWNTQEQTLRYELAMSRFRLKIRSKPNYQSSERLELPSMRPVDHNYCFQGGGLTAYERLYIKCAAMRPGADSPGNTLAFCVSAGSLCAYGYPVYSLEVNIK